MNHPAAALPRAVMKLLQLTVIVRDVQTATIVAQSFTRSPVLVGRQYGNQLRLDARMVSRRHGAFLFSKDGLQYIDYGSANGTFVDSARIAPNIPKDIRDSSVITIAPFQIVAHIDLVDTRRLSNDPNAETPMVSLRPRSTTPDVRVWQDILDDSAARRRLGSGSGSLEVLQRAVRVIETIADGMLAAGSRTAKTLSPLRLAATPDEMVALLLDPGGGEQRFTELRELLAELLRPRLTSVP
jgi:pSer/pThr/pTyr-binding forkhead associated (FHA) protein